MADHRKGRSKNDTGDLRAEKPPIGGAKADARSRNTDLLLKTYKQILDRKRSKKSAQTADAS